MGAMAPRAEHLAVHIEALTQHGPRHPKNPRAVQEALSYITSSLEDYGYELSIHRYGDQPHQVNVTVQCGELSADTGVVDVGVHWDTVPDSPGADDNASGVASLLEIAKELTQISPSQPVRLCFFGEEEVGGFPGSTAHIEASLGRGEQIDAAIVLEMIAYRSFEARSQQLPEPATMALRAMGTAIPHIGDFIAVIGDSSAEPWVTSLVTAAETSAPSLKTFPLVAPAGFIQDAGRSDHAVYWQRGIPGVMLSDTANFRNPHYHKRTDTLDTLDLEFAADVTEMLLQALVSHAE